MVAAARALFVLILLAGTAPAAAQDSVDPDEGETEVDPQLLVGKRQAKSETASLGQHVANRNRETEEVLGLVNNSEKRCSSLGRDPDSAQGGLPHHGYQQAADESRGFFA